MTGSIHVGTSGYSFADWVGTVYPGDARPTDFLRHYGRWFDAVEINATYYRIPPPETFAAILRKTSPEFVFTVKLPKEMTHERDRADEALRPFLEAIAPIRDAQQLGAVLAQFPFSFRNTPEGLGHVERISAPFVAAGIPINVEFRHGSWYDDATPEALRASGIGFVNVDLPSLPNLPTPSGLVTSDVAYFRLHGRNAAMWWNHPTPSDRYDYLYNDEELEDWAQRVEQVAASATTTFVFNNNCHLGQSVVNALQLHQRLGLAKPATPTDATAELMAPSTAERIRTLRARITAARADRRG